MNLTSVGFGVVFIIAGILFACRKLLPRSFKNLSEEEKAKIRIKPLCLNVGIMIIIGGVILLLRGFIAQFAGRPFIITIIIWIILCIADIIFIAKSNRYHKK